MKMFNLLGIGERAGSGIPEIFEAWRNEGWKEPQIEEYFDYVERTRLILHFKGDHSIGEDNLGGTPQVTPQDKSKGGMLDRILSFCADSKSMSEIMCHFGYSDPKHFRMAIIRPLLQSEKLQMTIPDKPNSRYQKYIAKG